MTIGVRASELHEIELLRENYRAEMNCQIIHDSIHARPGWTREFALYDDGALIGYGSVAVAGPWRDAAALYEFFIDAQHRMRTFEAFTTLLPTCGAKIIETQSNDPFLTECFMFSRITYGPNRFSSRMIFKRRSSCTVRVFAPRRNLTHLSFSGSNWTRTQVGSWRSMERLPARAESSITTIAPMATFT